MNTATVNALIKAGAHTIITITNSDTDLIAHYDVYFNVTRDQEFWDILADLDSVVSIAFMELSPFDLNTGNGEGVYCFKRQPGDPEFRRYVYTLYPSDIQTALFNGYDSDCPGCLRHNAHSIFSHNQSVDRATFWAESDKS